MELSQEQKKLPIGTIIKASMVGRLVDLETQKQHFERVRTGYFERCENLVLQAQNDGFEQAATTTVAELVDYVGELEAHLDAKCEQIIPMIADVFEDVITEIVGTSPTPETLEALLKHHLPKIVKKFPVTLIVDPKIFAIASETAQSCARSADAKIEVIGDDNLSNGQIVVKTDHGYFNLGIEQQTHVAKRMIAKGLSESLLDVDFSA